MNSNGQLFWLTGLAGAGKTTVGRELFQMIRQTKPNVVFLDGDVLREVFGNNEMYTRDSRLSLAHQYARLCKILTDQGLDVVCATISFYQSCRDWNREHVERYREIYLRASMAVLVERDQKELYTRALRGEITNVVGIDLPVEEPTQPDLIIDNDGRRSPHSIAQDIFDRYYAA